MPSREVRPDFGVLLMQVNDAASVGYDIHRIGSMLDSGLPVLLRHPNSTASLFFRDWFPAKKIGHRC
ncbi:MAG: hypothetical protein P1U77_03950 [Rubripirellula sp.]|nr:hypothetical protein [Rubripirellula sp.]